jgi:hypothetical protein
MLAAGWSIFTCSLAPHCGSGGIGFRMAPLSEQILPHISFIVFSPHEQIKAIEPQENIPTGLSDSDLIV